VWPRPAVGAGATGVGGGHGVGQNDGGFTGGRFPYLPWVVVARGGGIPGGGGLEGELGGGGVPVFRGGRLDLWLFRVRRGTAGLHL
jgi:hypothetical protein